MSPQKLIEAALLDAGGLLDADESAAFERAFAEAPPELRAQVRREQARFADLTELLPDVSPRPELRQFVIDAVAAAMGRDRDAAGRRVLAHAAAERAVLPSHRRGVALWRLGTFAFGTAAIVVGVLAFQLHRDFGNLGQRIASNETAQLFLMPDAGFRRAVLSGEFTRVTLTPVEGGPASAEMAVFLNPATGKGHIAYFRLPPLAERQTYQLVTLDDRGDIGRTLHTFASSGEIGGAALDLGASTNATLALAVMTAEGPRILMRSA
jgi:hypothetical protein